ncbi:hypothetical protein M0805_001942 [Coniferiporia weirii]|nr:hypothetical protein M0805_001942 [Coniferiporia weirii]
MKSISGAIAVLAVVSICGASPVKRTAAAEISDQSVLNFALTLEHLEVSFYAEGLALFDEAAFAAAGLPAFARGRFLQISAIEQTHASVLTAAIGENATQPCNYSFPFTDPKAFASLSAVLESVGTSAYTGAASLLSDPTYVTAAASILATEARQASFVMAAVNRQNPWSTPFETPLDLNQAFSLAAGFIVSCPSTNPVLPVRAFPTLSIASTSYTPGSNVSLAFDRNASGAAQTNADTPLFLTLLTGLGKLSTPVRENSDGTWSATLPETLQGTVYALVTDNNSTATDSDTVAGVAILEFPFDSQANELS